MQFKIFFSEKRLQKVKSLYFSSLKKLTQVSLLMRSFKVSKIRKSTHKSLECSTHLSGL